MVFWKNDLWIMLHHKFICLLCVHHFSFFLNIDSPFFFLLDVTKSSSSSFFLSFSNFLILMDFFYWWTVCQTKVQTINVRWPLFKVIWKKNICSFKAQRGNNKGWHFFFLMIKKHGHTSFPKHDYFLFQEVSTQEENWFMLQVVPYFYSCLFFLPKPPFQVFILADIFYFLFSC